MRHAKGADMAWMAVYLFLFASGLSAYTSFVTFWQNGIGYSKMLIGLLSSGSAFIAALAQPALSLAADRSRSKNRVLRLMLCVQAAAAFLHMVTGPWAYVFAVMSLMTAFQSAALGLSNAVVLDALRRRGEPDAFGSLRLGYSWGFAAAGLAAGFIACRAAVAVFALCGAVNLLALLVSFGLPASPGFQSSGRRMGVRCLMKYREYVVLLLYSFCVHTTHSLAVAFLPVHFCDLRAPAWAYGLGIFAMAAAETPFLLLSGRLIGRFGVRKLMLVPGAAFALRWALTAAASQWWHLLALYALHGAGIIVVYVCLARYVSDRLPKELSATGQGIVNAAVISASRVSGALIGGALMTWIGVRETFFAMAGLSLASLAGLWLYIRRNPDGPPATAPGNCGEAQ